MIEGRYRALVTHEELEDAGSVAPLGLCAERLWKRSGACNVNSGVLTVWRDFDACAERFRIHFDSSFWTG